MAYVDDRTSGAPAFRDKGDYPVLSLTGFMQLAGSARDIVILSLLPPYHCLGSAAGE